MFHPKATTPSSLRKKGRKDQQRKIHTLNLKFTPSQLSSTPLNNFTSGLPSLVDKNPKQWEPLRLYSLFLTTSATATYPRCKHQPRSLQVSIGGARTFSGSLLAFTMPAIDTWGITLPARYIRGWLSTLSRPGTTLLMASSRSWNHRKIFQRFFPSPSLSPSQERERECTVTRRVYILRISTCPRWKGDGFPGRVAVEFTFDARLPVFLGKFDAHSMDTFIKYTLYSFQETGVMERLLPISRG